MLRSLFRTLPPSANSALASRIFFNSPTSSYVDCLSIFRKFGVLYLPGYFSSVDLHTFLDSYFFTSQLDKPLINEFSNLKYSELDGTYFRGLNPVLTTNKFFSEELYLPGFSHA